MNKITYKHDIVEFQDFLSLEECSALIEYYDSADEKWEKTCFYNARVMDPKAPMEKGVVPEINDQFFNNLRNRLSTLAEDVMQRPVRNLTLSAHKWLPGAFAGDHADNAELDGTPNAWQDNKLVTIIYLNDNYEGGHLTFRDHNLSISPKAGSAIVFDVGIKNVHGVTEVTSGERYTMLLSWDFADIDYPEGFLEELRLAKLSEKPKQDKQKEVWESGRII